MTRTVGKAKKKITLDYGSGSPSVLGRYRFCWVIESLRVKPQKQHGVLQKDSLEIDGQTRITTRLLPGHGDAVAALRV
jgi:hypothetical protein